MSTHVYTRQHVCACYACTVLQLAHGLACNVNRLVSSSPTLWDEEVQVAQASGHAHAADLRPAGSWAVAGKAVAVGMCMAR